MADNYTIITQYQDVETKGGQFARDVTVVGVETSGHGVYFERRYPTSSFNLKIAQEDALGFSIVFEDLFQIPGVEAVIWGEQLNVANQLSDYVDVYYTSTSGDSSDFVHVPFAKLTQAYVAGLVKKGRAELDALEAS